MRALLRLGARAGSRLDLLIAFGPLTALRHRRLARRFWGPSHSYAAVNRRIWSEAARELGAEVAELEGGMLELSRGDRRTRVFGHVTPIDDPVTLRVALQRPLVHRRLREAGVAVPDHVEFPSARPAPALAFMRARHGRFVVKPAGGTSGGAGVTCGVRTRRQLIRACAAAAWLDERLIVERQADGDMYRLLFLDGELLGAVRRRSPSVTGDGRSTVAELIAAENRRRLLSGGKAGLVLLRPDLDCLFTLRDQGVGLRSVPKAGRDLVVKTATSENAAEENEVVPARAEDPAAREALAAVGPVGLRFAGVDVIASDLTLGLEATGGAVIEVNGTPGLHYHYLVAEPESAVRVAIPVLRGLLAEGGSL